MEERYRPTVHRNKRFRHGIYILPSLFTVANLFCGYYAIVACMRGDFDNAAKAIGFAIVFDGLDGRIARLTNSTSLFGLEFDSLADVITFGIAPAFLAYSWGVRLLEPVEASRVVHNLQQLGWVVTFAYLICGAARLARFNIQSLTPLSHPEKVALPTKKHFVGMPIPAGAGFIAATVHFFQGEPLITWQFSAVWLALVALVAVLMVSTLRYYSFKDIDLRSRRPYVAIIAIGIVIGGIYFFSHYVLLFMALAYASSGIVIKIVSWIRPRHGLPEHPVSHTP